MDVDLKDTLDDVVLLIFGEHPLFGELELIVPGCCLVQVLLELIDLGNKLLFGLLGLLFVTRLVWHQWLLVLDAFQLKMNLIYLTLQLQLLLSLTEILQSQVEDLNGDLARMLK